MGRRPLVVEAEAAKGAGQGRIGGDVHQLRAEAKRAELRQLEPRRPGKGRLPAEDPVELDRMTDRLVDLERHLLAAEDQVGRIQGRALIGRQEGARLLGDPRRIGRQIQLADKLPAAGTVLTPDPRVAALLRLALADGQRRDRRPALYDLSLIHISEPTRLGMISYAVF